MITINHKCKVQLPNEDHHDKYKKSMLCRKREVKISDESSNTLMR